MSDLILKAALTRLGDAMAKEIKEQGEENGPALNPLHSLIDSPDLHVILVGTGTPVASEHRSGPSTAVVGQGLFFLVDVGKQCSIETITSSHYGWRIIQ